VLVNGRSSQPPPLGSSAVEKRLVDSVSTMQRLGFLDAVAWGLASCLSVLTLPPYALLHSPKLQEGRCVLVSGTQVTQSADPKNFSWPQILKNLVSSSLLPVGDSGC